MGVNLAKPKPSDNSAAKLNRPPQRGNGKAKHPPTAMAKPSRTSRHQRHNGEAEPPPTAMAKPSRTGLCVIGQAAMG